MNVNLHIERLVLDGISVGIGELPRLQQVVEGELARLLVDKGDPRAWLVERNAPRLSADTIQLLQSTTPTELGVQIAQAAYGGLGGKADRESFDALPESGRRLTGIRSQVGTPFAGDLNRE